ncbi:MAG: lamin tail domain-containing protein [Flavobacteriales bacterium]
MNERPLRSTHGLLALVAATLLTPAVSEAQVTIFSENMGTVSATTAIATHDANNGFQNSAAYDFTGTGDVRTSTASSGYTGASGAGNIFLTNTSNPRTFIITGINTEGFVNMTLSFGANKSTTISDMSELVVEVSTDGIAWNALTFPAQPTGSGTTNWRLVTITGGIIPSAATVSLRWSNTGGPQFRIDDITLAGELAGGCGITLGAVNTSCVTITPGDADTYDLTIAYSGVDAGVTVNNNSGSGTIGGDDPAVTADGTIVISGINETDNYNVTFSAPCDALTVSGTAPDCDPPPCGITFGTASTACVTVTPGLNDTYDLSIPYTGVQAGVTVVNNGASGTVAGDDPAVTADGTIVISGISEADDYNVSLSSPCDAVTVSGAAPSCTPPFAGEVIGFDEAANWTAGSVAITSYAVDHSYVENNWSFTGGPALRNGTAAQDGFPGALNTFSWRLRDVATTDWRATYQGAAAVTEFGFKARRWDASPTPDYSVSYSTDGGTNWSASVFDINNTSLNGASDWVLFTTTIPSPAAVAPGQFIVRVLANAVGERIMIDDFQFDVEAGSCGLGIGAVTTACETQTSGVDTYTLTIPYTGVQAGVTVTNNSGSGAVGGDDPAVTPNGTIVITGIIENDAYNVSFTAPCEAIVVSGNAPACLPPPTLVINEIDYDQSGTDPAEFIELKNTGTETVNLTGMRIELINGSNGSLYNTINLDPVLLAAGDYYVVGHAIVPNVDQVVFTANGSIQNGSPDGLRLMTGDNVVIDQMSYEGVMSTTEGTSAGADTNDDVLGLSRVPDGQDTNDNGVDFVLACISPGAANSVSDADNDGTLDCLDVCANGPEPGTPCDDGIAATGNDVIQPDCSCAGEATDCLGVVGGTALPGTPCDDEDPDTVNDVYLNDCSCQGTPLCSTDLVIEFQTDGAPQETTWEIRAANGLDLVQSGGPLVAPNGIQTEFTCLPDGCFTFFVLDAAGDGMTTGGYILRTLNDGSRIIDNRNNFSNGSVSAISGGQGFCLPMSNDKLVFTSCDKLDWVSGQYVVAAPNAAVSAEWIPNAANNLQDNNSGYEFWIFDPNGSYSFRRFRSHNVSDGFGPASATRACHMKLNNWALASQVPANVLMNVRVRARVNGVNGAFGPACRMEIDPVLAACPRTNLMDIPDNQYLSCGATRQWGIGNYVHARPVAGANRYQFRFRIPAEGFTVVRQTTTYFLQLNWPTLPLEVGKTYDVDVRVSKDGGATWCSTSDPWGNVCQLTIGTINVNAMTTMVEDRRGEQVTNELRMFPNPNRGDVLTFSLSSVEQGVSTVSVDIYDLTGKRMSARTVAVAGNSVNTTIDLGGELAAGMYLVNITAGNTSYTERLVIQP